MNRLYDRLAKTYHSINQLNKLHIALENRLAPDEVLRLSDYLTSQHRSLWLDGYMGRFFGRLDRRLPSGILPGFRDRCRAQVRIEHSKSWSELLRKRLHSKPGHPEFKRRAVRGSIHLYSSVSPKADKTLLIGLSGNAGRLMMPIPFVLACLDPSSIDVALLRTRKNAGYRNGAPGLAANTLEESVGEIEEVLQTTGYRQVVVLGTSGGALPSIYVASHLRADAVMAVGGNNPNDDRWTTHLQGRDMGSWLLGPCRENPARKPRIYLVAGQNHKRDMQAIFCMHELVDATAVIQIPNCSHNPLYPLYQRQALEELLSKTILTKFDDHPGLTGEVMYQ